MGYERPLRTLDRKAEKKRCTKRTVWSKGSSSSTKSRAHDESDSDDDGDVGEQESGDSDRGEEEACEGRELGDSAHQSDREEDDRVMTEKANETTKLPAESYISEGSIKE